MKTTFKSPRSLRLFILIVGILLGVSAQATTDHFQAFDAWPSVGEKYYFINPSAQGLYKNQFTFGVSNQFLIKSLSVLNTSGAVLNTTIDKAVIHFVTAGYGISDAVQLGLTVPIISMAQFADPTITPIPASSRVFAVGDIKLSSKIRVLNSYKTRWGFALEPFVTVPLKGYEKFLGEKGVTGGIRTIGEFLISKKVRADMNLGLQYHSQRVVLNNINYHARLLGGLGLSADVTPDICLSGELATTASLSNFSKKDTTPMEFLAGVQWGIKDTGFKLGAAGGSCLICGARAAKVRGVVNLSYTRPGDVYDLKDKENLEMLMVALGEVPENLEETIVILKDKCPEDPNDYNPQIHDVGCPKYFELKETVVDLSQRSSPEQFAQAFLSLKENCPENPSDFNPEKHDPGCPKYFKLREAIVTLTGQTDDSKFSEVILAIKQHCPQNIDDFDPAQHDPGCPEYFALKQRMLPLLARSDKERDALKLMGGKDTDHDSIPDLFDDCPKDPEDYNGIADGDGCPESGVVVAHGEIKTIAPVHFEFNKTILSKEAKEILNFVSEALLRHPEIDRLEVVGHADPIGTPQANDKISLQRAEVVSKYLKIRGVPGDLVFVPMGVGTRFPVAPNDTEAGREQNRRVEFHFSE